MRSPTNRSASSRAPSSGCRRYGPQGWHARPNGTRAIGAPPVHSSVSLAGSVKSPSGTRPAPIGVSVEPYSSRPPVGEGSPVSTNSVSQMARPRDPVVSRVPWLSPRLCPSSCTNSGSRLTGLLMLSAKPGMPIQPRPSHEIASHGASASAAKSKSARARPSSSSACTYASVSTAAGSGSHVFQPTNSCEAQRSESKPRTRMGGATVVRRLKRPHEARVSQPSAAVATARKYAATSPPNCVATTPRANALAHSASLRSAPHTGSSSIVLEPSE
eukprot:scaffold297048_cov26-Tisochrysis_lutea.AAC.2